MNRRLYILLWLMLLHYTSFSQDTLRHAEKKFQVSFNIGACFKGFLSERYIEPTPYSYDDPYQAHQFDRFTKIPAYGFGAGLLFSYKISGNWSIAIGLSYYFRKTIYKNSEDTVIAYAYQTNIHNIHNVFKYNYSYNNLELPLLVQYRLRKITFYTGIQLSVLSFRKANYTYVMNQYPQDPVWYTSQKKMTGFVTTFRIYPTFKISYDLKIKNLAIKPFIGIEIFEINMKDFYFHIQTSPFYISMNGPSVENCYFVQAGLIIPLSKSK